MPARLKPYAKAVVAFALPALAAAGASMLDGDLTNAELVIAAGTGLVTGAAVYGVKNANPVG